jgi:hypothetical protein
VQVPLHAKQDNEFNMKEDAKVIINLPVIMFVGVNEIVKFCESPKIKLE